ncbi:hypothetical protein D7Z26_03645 [Cohnella endophytica]|uniref:Uncharacterized protein n=1 Tax=Cohnella endophytica TaxID=2419778 RepID=A0A494Y355_9BACL|nr:hypothetical protein [Cohnella endophytica]RKP57089.1 hypothetical protein D7Z26_03645 [Cohnella endophytica]
MEKRLNRSDLIFSLAFILMLIIAVGAFFYGVRVGTDRVEAKYAAAETPESSATPQPNAYQQQDLVSFYHTVFLPYREFQNDWLKAQDKWLSDPTADRAASMKDLAKSAQHKYDAIKKVQVSSISQQLKDSQTNYLKSLKLFNESFSKLAASANQGTGQLVLDKVNADSYYKNGLTYFLSAQKQYFGSMLKWAESIDPNITGDYENSETLTISKWKTLPLVVKMKVASDYLSSQTQLVDFLPHDLTARVDQFIVSGQADKRKIISFNAIAELLMSTGAVRSGDFISMKSRYYENEQLPQLPFFFSDN